MKRPRMLIADDHTLVAEACKNLLEPEFEVVGTGKRPGTHSFLLSEGSADPPKSAMSYLLVRFAAA
jgi:hypothetical protein